MDRFDTQCDRDVDRFSTKGQAFQFRDTLRRMSTPFPGNAVAISMQAYDVIHRRPAGVTIALGCLLLRAVGINRWRDGGADCAKSQ